MKKLAISLVAGILIGVVLPNWISLGLAFLGIVLIGLIKSRVIKWE